MKTPYQPLNRDLRGLFVVAALFACVPMADAQQFVIDGNVYLPTDTAEIVHVGAWSMQTAETQLTYSGYVLVTATGSWSYTGSHRNDLLYYYGVNPVNLVPMYFGTAPITVQNQPPIQPYDGNYPAYNPAHEYSLVVNVGLNDPGFLYFGFGDSYWGDNVGSVAVALTQLQSAAVPEPGVWGLVVGALALGVVVWGRFRRRLPGASRSLVG